jgi:hypothetical protein
MQQPFYKDRPIVPLRKRRGSIFRLPRDKITKSFIAMVKT